MADRFRRLLDEKTGPGGAKCGCCNWSREIMNRKARKRTRRKLKKIIKAILKRELKSELKEME